MTTYPHYLIAARNAADAAADAAHKAVEAIAAATTPEQKTIARINWDFADDAKTEAYRAYMAAKARYLTEIGKKDAAQ